MKSLYVKPTLNSPEVNFDVESREFVISGQSILTDAQEFYGPIIEWLDKYSSNASEDLVFKFSLNYYNLASAKRFMFIIFMLSKMRRNGVSVQIVWKFFKDDEFMREFGEDLSENFDVPLTLLPSNSYTPKVKLAG